MLLLLQSSGLNPKPPDARQGFSYHRAQMFSSHSHHYCHHHRHQSCPSAILYPHEVRVFWLLPPPSSLIPFLLLSASPPPFLSFPQIPALSFTNILRPSLTVVLNSLCHRAGLSLNFQSSCLCLPNNKDSRLTAIPLDLQRLL